MIFLAGLVLSCIFSSRPFYSWYNLYKYIFFISLFYLAILDDTLDRYYLFVFIFSALVVSILALRSLWIITPYILSSSKVIEGKFSFVREFLARRRVFFPFVSPNMLGGYLSMLLPLVVILSIEGFKRKYGGIVFSLIGMIMLSVLFFTKSIGAWVSIFASTCLYFLLVGRRKRSFLFIFLLFVLLSVTVYLRFHNQAYFLTPPFSLDRRIVYAQETLKIISKKPIFGTGLGVFSLKETLFAHNSYLQFWAEVGVIPFLAYLSLVFFFLREGIRKIKNTTESKFIHGMFIGGLVFCIHNVVDFSFFSSQVAFLWWLFLGIVLRDSRFVSFIDHKSS